MKEIRKQVDYKSAVFYIIYVFLSKYEKIVYKENK